MRGSEKTFIFLSPSASSGRKWGGRKRWEGGGWGRRSASFRWGGGKGKRVGGKRKKAGGRPSFTTTSKILGDREKGGVWKRGRAAVMLSIWEGGRGGVERMI